MRVVRNIFLIEVRNLFKYKFVNPGHPPLFETIEKNSVHKQNQFISLIKSNIKLLFYFPPIKYVKRILSYYLGKISLLSIKYAVWQCNKTNKQILVSPVSVNITD